MEEKGLFIHLRNFEGDGNGKITKISARALIKQPKKIGCGKEIAGKIRKSKK